MLSRDKHSSLLWQSINDGKKSFVMLKLGQKFFDAQNFFILIPTPTEALWANFTKIYRFVTLLMAE